MTLLITTLVLAVALIYVVYVNYKDNLKDELKDTKEILTTLYSKDGAKAIYDNVIKPLWKALKETAEWSAWLFVVLFAFIIVPIVSIIKAFTDVHQRRV